MLVPDVQQMIQLFIYIYLGFPRSLSGKESACQCRRCGFNSWVWEIPWRRKWQPTPVFLPGKSHRQRSLSGCSPWGPKRVRQGRATEHASVCVYIYISFFRLFSIIDNYKILNVVPCANSRSLLFIYFIYSSMYRLSLNSKFILPFSALVTISFVSMSLYLFYK